LPRSQRHFLRCAKKHNKSSGAHAEALGVYDFVAGNDSNGQAGHIEPLHPAGDVFLDIRDQRLDAIQSFTINKAGTARPSDCISDRCRSTKKCLGPIISVALLLNNLALLYNEQGRYEDVELLDKRSLAIYEQWLGPNHLAVAQALNNFALLYYNPRSLCRGRTAVETLTGDKRKSTRSRPY
jgi:hypothetical protein